MPTLSDRVYKRLSIALCMFFFGFVFYKAGHMSMTFDESWTTQVLDASYWDTMFAERFFQSANNHLLNSILMKLSAGMLGMSEIALRLPNVLSYLFYFIGSYIIVRESTNDNWLRFAGLILLNTLLFVLDFFSVARGYGLACGFEMMSLAMMIQFMRSTKQRDLFLSFLFASLAVYSNFTWLNFYVPLWAIYNVMDVLDLKNIGLFVRKLFIKNSIPLFFSIILTALSYKPMVYLHRQDEFRWGATSWMESFHTFMKDLLYDNNDQFAMIGQIILLLLYLVALILTIRWVVLSFRERLANQNLVFITLLISTIVLATIVQHYLLHTMYMDGRKALMYFPLVMILLLLIVSHFITSKSVLIFSISMMLIGVGVFHFFYRVNIHAVREWWYDENTKEVAYYVHAHPVNGKQDVAVTWFFQPTMRFYNIHHLDTCIKKLDKFEEITDSTIYAYYYVMGDDIRKVPILYKPICRFAWDRIVLVKDSSAYLKARQYILDTMHQENATNILKADSILLDERKKIDWSNIPINKNGIE